MWVKRTMVVTGNDQSASLSFALDSEDHPHISYYDDINKELEYGFYNGIVWVNETIDSNDDCGHYSSISIDSNDNPHIGYIALVNQTNLELRYAHSDGFDWYIETIDTGDDEVWSVDLYLDSNDNPHIAYYENRNNTVKYAYRTQSIWRIEETCTNGTIAGPDDYSFALDLNDKPYICFVENNVILKYAYRKNTDWHVTTVDSSGDVGMENALAVDSNGNPHIAYPDRSMNHVKYA